MEIIKIVITLVAFVASTQAVDIWTAEYAGMDELEMWLLQMIMHSKEMQYWYGRPNESMTSHQCSREGPNHQNASREWVWSEKRLNLLRA